MTAKAISDKIQQTVIQVRDVSYIQKTEFTEQATIDQFLDTINDFRNFLKSKAKTLNGITDRLDQITWLKVESENDLKSINELIAIARDLKRTSLKRYSQYNRVFRSKGICVDELNALYDAISNFREAISDLDSSFFILPYDKEFQEANRQLSKLG